MNMDDWTYEPARDHGLPLLERLRSLKRESGLIESVGHMAWWAAIRSYLRIFHRLHVEGVENLPKEPPFVMVANHASHLDALILASRLHWRLRDDVYPIAAGDTFFETPVAAAFAAVALNALPMWRKRGGGRHALEDLRARLLSEKCVYVLFPEGTRSRDGSIGSFKAGIGMVVAETKVPVIPCYLRGAFESMPPDGSWPRFKRICLRIGDAIRFDDVSNDREGWNRVAQELQRAVSTLSAPKKEDGH
jgi:1-acyl-sn-glycerol-3-phosphate acyltransferase